MDKNGPIVNIEDDEDDQEILKSIFTRLPIENRIVFLADGYQALEYLQKELVKPFLILSDINMPVMNGFELRRLVFENQVLRSKCVPYLFFTTSISDRLVAAAYALSVQGFFIKPDTVTELEKMITRIVEYWQDCISPNM